MSTALSGPAAIVQDLLARSGPEWVQQRRARVGAFLRDRDLDPAWLAGFLQERVGPGQLLLTSSPVQGLANPTSDLDFIRIQAGPMAGPRIATKIFERGHHLEVLSFSAAELTHNLAGLTELATRPPGEVVAGFRSWDTRLEPRRKQTERIVNGITLDGAMPWLGSLPALSVVWSCASLHTAAEQVAHLCLAEAAGETRGRLGYAVNAVLHLADALLSRYGDVYTTRKWYLLRWARARLADTAPDPAGRAAAAAADAARGELAQAWTRPELPLAPRYTALLAQVAQLSAAARQVSVAVGLDPEVRYHHFLPGAGLLTGAASSIVVPGPQAPGRVSGTLTDLAGLPAGHATALLRAVRAGLARVQVTYQRTGDQPAGPSPEVGA